MTHVLVNGVRHQKLDLADLERIVPDHTRIEYPPPGESGYATAHVEGLRVAALFPAESTRMPEEGR